MSSVRGPSIVTNGLSLYLDAGNLKSYPGSGTLWTDLSGNANHGTLVGSITYSNTNGGSLYITGGTTQYISLPNGVLSGTGDFTVNQWIKSVSSGSTCTVFANYPAGNLQILYGNTFVGVWLNTAVYACSATPCAYYNSNWNMITSVRNGTTVNYYLNGVSIVSGTSSSTIGTSSASFRIGTNTNGGEVYTGNISVTQAYNRALSSQEISQNFNAMRGRYGL